MKKILFKAFEEDGRQFYVYELPEEAQLDEDTLDMCEDGALKGIVPMEYVDDADAFYYDISGYKTISKALRGEVDSSDVLDVMYGITRVLFEFKENGVPLSHLILHKDFIFIDRMTMEVKFLCVPLEEEAASNIIEDVSRFFRVLLSGLTYDINENGSYVTKLFTLLNTPEQFNISILGNALQDLMDEYGVPYEDNLVSGTYGEIDGDYDADDIATIDASILEGMPESVSVAEMEAQAYEDGQEADEYDENVDAAEETGEDTEYESEALAEEEYEETASEYEDDAAYDEDVDAVGDAVYDEDADAAEETGEDAEYESEALAEEEYEETASEYEDDAAYDEDVDAEDDAAYDKDVDAAGDAVYDEDADAAEETGEEAEYESEALAEEEYEEPASEYEGDAAYDEDVDAVGDAAYDEGADAVEETGEDADVPEEAGEAAEYDADTENEDKADAKQDAEDAVPGADAAAPEELPDNMFGDDDEFKSVKKVMTEAPKAQDSEKELTDAEIEAQERERRELTRKVVFDEETKRKQQEALRKIAEAGNAKNTPKKQRLVLNRGGLEDIDEALAEIEARKAAEEARKAEEEALGDTAVLKGKPKQHKFGLAKETVVRPVFDSVFEPIIETIDGPIDDMNIPEPYVAAPKPAQAAKEKAKKEGAAGKSNMDDGENSDSILSQDVTKTPEPGLLSQLDERAETMPKVNPYLIRVNNGERIMITKATFKIGKASFGMDYTVTDNGAISRNHCVIIAKDGVYYIRDNKSTNHTYVNGQIVKSGQEILLTHESIIRIADEDFQFKLR